MGFYPELPKASIGLLEYRSGIDKDRKKKTACPCHVSRKFFLSRRVAVF
jgi:hypothetical protein